MEKEVKKVVSHEEITHEFYCDGCGALVGKSIELQDGYYDEFGGFGQEFKLINRGGTLEWYTFSKCYCDECCKSATDAIRKAIIGLGFEKGR